MTPFTSLALAGAVLPLLVACQVVEHPGEIPDGVYRGGIETAGKIDTHQVHLLDGLALGLGLDSQRSLSAELVGTPQALALTVVRRDNSGFVEQRQAFHGEAFLHDGITAVSRDGRSELDWYYDPAASDGAAPHSLLAGQYSYSRNSFQVSLAVFADGRIEGYDNLGCGYFGWLQIPDWRRNLYSVAIDVEGCTLRPDFAYGIASAEGNGVRTLVLPLWFDADDRIETWILDRD